MYNIDSCPACGSDNITKLPAYMHEFVAWRVTGYRPHGHLPIKGVHCLSCQFTCSDSRLDDREEQLLYDDYRGASYNQQRIACEPTYENYLNNFDSNEYMQIRRFGIMELINKYVDAANIQTVLDYGGNKGEHIPQVFNHAKRYVYDISNVGLLPGVELFDVNSTEVMDFIMCCHVLEHKSEPAELIEQIKKYADNNTWFYIEVPDNEIYSLPGAVFHEHINSFTYKSMVSLLSRHGIEVVEIISTSANNEHIMCVLGKLK
jgi:hypothetical protein